MRLLLATSAPDESTVAVCRCNYAALPPMSDFPFTLTHCIPKLAKKATPPPAATIYYRTP